MVAVEICLVEEVNQVEGAKTGAGGQSLLLVVGEDLEAVTGLILVEAEEAIRMVDRQGRNGLLVMYPQACKGHTFVDLVRTLCRSAAFAPALVAPTVRAQVALHHRISDHL